MPGPCLAPTASRPRHTVPWPRQAGRATLAEDDLCHQQSSLTALGASPIVEMPDMHQHHDGNDGDKGTQAWTGPRPRGKPPGQASPQYKACTPRWHLLPGTAAPPVSSSPQRTAGFMGWDGAPRAICGAGDWAQLATAAGELLWVPPTVPSPGQSPQDCAGGRTRGPPGSSAQRGHILHPAHLGIRD